MTVVWTSLARRLSRSAIRAASGTLSGQAAKGEGVSQQPPDPLRVRPHLLDQRPYYRNGARILRRHAAQTVEDVAALRRKYEAPVFGKVSVWSLVEKLAQCIDPTDGRLFCTSQLVHVLQILAEMEADGVASEEFVLAALVHDLGKVLLVAGEPPENVVGMNDPIGTYEPGIGLENCVLQWNHDEFAYSRLKDHLPEGLAWLVRYHSINRATCEPYMNEKDRAYAARYLDLFERYDHGTKSPFFLPKRPIDEYRHVIEKALPPTILF
jgi:predicted HD phosphohydrolase